MGCYRTVIGYKINQTMKSTFCSWASASNKMRLLLFGKPVRVGAEGDDTLMIVKGSGKGTMSQKLENLDTYKVNVLSAGDILRANVRKGTALGQKADSVIKQGGKWGTG